MKKALWITVVAFVVFCLVTRPEETSQAVRSFIEGLKSIGHFFASLVH